MTRPPLIKDRPFIQQSGLTERWYFVQSWRDLGDGMVEAHVKWDITDDIASIVRRALEDYAR